MKLSFLLVLIASALLLSGASENAEQNTKSKEIRTDKHQESPKEVQTAAEKQPEKPTPFQIELLETLRTIADQQKATSEQNDVSQKSWYTPSVLVNIGLLVVGTFYTIFACLQWRAIRHQAKIATDGVIETRKAAEAAKQSADAAYRQIELIAIHERPWLIVNPDKAPEWLISDKNPFGGPVEWSAKNVGRTPAFLIELAVMVNVIPYPIPDHRPEYPQTKPFAKFIIPPNGTHSSRTGQPMDASKLQSLFNGTHCLVFYGRIAYRDSLDGPHLTRFCCYWRLENGQWLYEPVGPPDWVEYT